VWRRSRHWGRRHKSRGGYRTLCSNQIILQIQVLHTDKGGIFPSLEVLDWQGPVLPAAEVIDALPFARPTPAI